MLSDAEHLLQPITKVANTDFATFHHNCTVGDALELLRKKGIKWGDKILYFYVVNDSDALVGVLPTRRLLMSSPETPLDEIMVKRVLSIPATATIMDGCEAFMMHKLLAFPVVDSGKRIVGTVDVGLLADEAFDIAERDETNAMFESIGLRVSQIRDAGPWKAYSHRFPWLLATISSGTICALLAGKFELTLAQSLILAFFLTLVLGLGESVAVQSMAFAIQSLRAARPSFGWYFRKLAKELFVVLLLGISCGTIVGLIAWVWRGTGLEGFVIGASIMMSLGAAGFIGLTVPTILHALKLDPKVAAGPLTLAFADICTLLAYFGLASLLL